MISNFISSRDFDESMRYLQRYEVPPASPQTTTKTAEKVSILDDVESDKDASKCWKGMAKR